MPPDGLAELRLGQEQEVLRAPAQDAQGSDHTGLRRQQERVASLSDPQRHHVVGDEALEQRFGLGAANADERPRARRDGEPSYRDTHPD